MDNAIRRKVLVLGAGGIVGQTMRICQRPDVEAIYHRRTPTPYFEACDFTTPSLVLDFLNMHTPDVIVNLVGENRPDVVEHDLTVGQWLNVWLPECLGAWCNERAAHLIHVSTQGVFGGDVPPYRACLITDGHPVNRYGIQKLYAEAILAKLYQRISIVRLTFVLGIRPLPRLARENPMERWADPRLPIKEVTNRWFSPCPVIDAARILWHIAIGQHPESPAVFHVGYPLTMSRHSLASLTRQSIGGDNPEPVMHESFKGIAERPRDTTFAPDALHSAPLFIDHLRIMARAWKDRMKFMSPDDRAIELAMFFKLDIDTIRAELGTGFQHFHSQVAESFRHANPQNDEQLLAWYRETSTYIWELTAYHLDAGFNYMGMCDGIRLHLANTLLKPSDDRALHVLCLGDGVGDLSLFLNESSDFVGYYHDLAGSMTAEFAALRYFRRYGTSYENRFVLSADWTPPTPSVQMDAVIALDIFEHLPNVEAWVQACFEMLRPGGLFMAQNGFAMGDDEHGGTIPMHLTRNNHYEVDWDPLLERTGFVRVTEGQTWWRRPWI